MKKLFCLFLTAALVLGMCACGGQKKDAETTPSLQVGFGREKFNPSGPVWISGGGNPNRVSETFLDYLYVTCIALTDAEDNTVMIITADLQGISTTIADPARLAISTVTGVPKGNIMIAGTHTHSAPGVHYPESGYTGVTAALEIFNKAIVRAAQVAMEDRSPAEISIGTAQTEGLAFIRHYKLENGTYAGANFGDFSSSPIADYAGNNDGEVQLIRFTRPAEGKKDVLLMSFGVHPTFHGSTSLFNLSADFPGPTRDHIEANSDCLVAYFTGAAGNQACSSRIEEHNSEAQTDYKIYGQTLGDYVLEALPDMQAVGSGTLQLSKKLLSMKTNKADLEKLAEATETYNAYLEGGYPLSDPLVAKYGFVRVFEARAIVNRAALGETMNVILYALSLGDISFTFAPYEMFTDNGMYIKANTPYEMTFLVGYANSGHGYIPSKEGCEFRSYEVYDTKLELGSGEVLADEFLSMLTELKGA